MYKLMQRYQKKLMAIFAVGLMIAFVIPQFNRASHSPSDMVMGTIGDEKISLEAGNEGRFLWQTLKERIAIQNQNRQTGQLIPMPLANVLGEATGEIDKHPILFVLLQREAIRNGVTVSDREIESLLSEIQV